MVMMTFPEFGYQKLLLKRAKECHIKNHPEINDLPDGFRYG
jgi:hypothetical protein